MDAIDINYLLKKKNSSQAKVARKLRITRCAVNRVVYGFSRSKRVMNEIARITGKTVDELWPARKDDGQAA